MPVVAAFLLVFALLSSWYSQALAQAADDPCLTEIPEGLRVSLAQKYPAHRLPRATDNLQVDRDYQVSHGGRGCLRVARGHFRSSSYEDTALLMTPVNGDGKTLLVVAWRDRKGSWRSEVIWRWHEASFRLFVEKAEPGRHERSQAVDEPLEKGELTSIVSRSDGVLSGMTGSFGYAFFWQKGRWVHVRVSD